jgi:hypothetical protein
LGDFLITYEDAMVNDFTVVPRESYSTIGMPCTSQKTMVIYFPAERVA